MKNQTNRLELQQLIVAALVTLAGLALTVYALLALINAHVVDAAWIGIVAVMAGAITIWRTLLPHHERD